MTDMTNAMVPTGNWGNAVREFSGHAPLPAHPQEGQAPARAAQAQLCAVCARAGDLTPPPAIVTIQGTVYCPSHAA